MSEPSDAELLRDYAERRNEATCRELVTRHADLAGKAHSVVGQLAEGASLACVAHDRCALTVFIS